VAAWVGRGLGLPLLDCRGQRSLERWREAEVEGDNEGRLTDHVEDLIGREAEQTLALHCVNQPVQEEFDQEEEKGTCEEPDHPGLDQGVGRQAVHPETSSAQSESLPIFGRLMPRAMAALVAGEKSSLERVIGNGVPHEEGKKKLGGCQQADGIRMPR